MSDTFLFPHCSAPEIIWNKIPSSLFPVSICKPWYMEPEERAGINVILPDKRLKPGKGFLELVKEYKKWVQDQGREGALFALFQQDFLSYDESPRHIKAIIRGIKKENSDKEKILSINWHMILHLATELELSQYEIDRAVEDMKKRGSPLAGIVEGASQCLDSFFKDVPNSVEHPLLDEGVIAEVIKAWIRLFGSYVSKDSTLLTFSKKVFYFLKSEFEESITKDIVANPELPVKEEVVDGVSLLRISFPESTQKKDLITGFIAGKKLLCII